MKTLLTIFLFAMFVTTCIAQNDLLPAFTKEIVFKGDVAYFNSSPFTGLLVDEKTNKKIGEYRNGYRNGKFVEYYTNGKKKSEGKFSNGVKEEIHIEWFENGNKKSECNYNYGQKDGIHREWFKNKQLKSSYAFNNGRIIDGQYVTYLENGREEKEEIYEGGLKTQEGIYKNGQLYVLSTTYYPGGQTKNLEGFLKDGVKDGSWSEWYENGQLKSKGDFADGKESSVWTWWWSNGEKKKEAKYEKGNLITLIYENDIDPEFSINAKLKSDSYLFRCLSNIEEDTAYVMVNFNFTRTGKNKEIEENILSALQLRLGMMYTTEKYLYGKKLLRYSIEFSNPQLTAGYDDGVSTKSLGILGKLTIQSSPGYRGRTTISMFAQDLKNNLSLFNDVIAGESDKYKNQSDAYSVTPTLIRQNIIDQIYHIFQIKTFIKDILETDGDGNAETVSITCGKNLSIAKRFIFYVYSEDDLINKLGEIEVDKAEYDKSECDVNEGEGAITKAIRSGKKIIAISKY